MIEFPEEVPEDKHVCAACDELVGEDHPAEFLCGSPTCARWFHGERCPDCKSPPLI